MGQNKKVQQNSESIKVPACVGMTAVLEIFLKVKYKDLSTAVEMTIDPE
jgi:hypothetical protein